MMNELEILDLESIYNILPFQKGKILMLIKSGCLPVVKIGRDYLTTRNILEQWIQENIGKEIFY